MKKTYHTLLVCLLMLFYLGAAGTDKYKTGRDKVISTPVEGNLYLAGASLTIDAAVGGDLTAAGRIITVNDSIYDDVILAGADIMINGVLGDDAKIAGNDIRILKSVNGDLIIAGAFIQISSDVAIDQDLVIFAGQAIISGTVKGNVKVTGGDITFNGIAQQDLDIRADELVLNGRIDGPATISSDEIEVGNDLEFKADLRYWSDEEEMDLASYAEGAVLFDEELEFDPDSDWTPGGGLSTFQLLCTLSIIPVIALLVALFDKTFQKAGEQMTGSYFKNFGYGMLYFIGLIVVTILCFVLIIGIPIGLVTLVILAFSLLFANAISSLVIANGIKTHYAKRWNKWHVMLVALVSFLVLKLVFLIPYAGWLIAIIIIGMAFGSLVLTHARWKT